MDYKTYRKENVSNLSQFSRTFNPWKKWQNVKLTDICPCNTCEVQKEYIDRRYEFMMSVGADSHLVERCKHCIDHINWTVECIEKLKWYENGGKMACNCKHNEKEIQDGKAIINELRNLFIKRMTEDSDHNDRRKKDYNQAIFSWWEEDKQEADPAKTFQCWHNMNMEMVLRCFDNAVGDWRRSWCDVESCKRKRGMSSD